MKYSCLRRGERLAKFKVPDQNKRRHATARGAEACDLGSPILGLLKSISLRGPFKRCSPAGIMLDYWPVDVFLMDLLARGEEMTKYYAWCGHEHRDLSMYFMQSTTWIETPF